MPIHLVREADVRAISIVGKGANRKRFFLRKSKSVGERLPSAERLLKAEDWSAVYCVVAEPDWHESPGSAPGTDQSVEDRWASEDEIRKAAHRFMANGGLVTKMHESLEPYGQLVENAVALADFTIDGETIRKGSWYVAIAPSTEGKAAIERGEFTGVSIEGLAVREPVEKSDFPTDNEHEMEARPMIDWDKYDREMAALAGPFRKQQAATVTKTDEDAEDRLAKKIAKEMVAESGPSWAERNFEREGVDPALIGLINPSPEKRVARALSKAAAAPTEDELRKACEEQGIDPALAGVLN